MGKGAEEEPKASKDGDTGGWYDDDGFWFEPAADGTAGFYDCYNPEGEWHQTGSYSEDGEWLAAEGEYDVNGNWVPKGGYGTEGAGELPGAVGAEGDERPGTSAAGRTKRSRDVQTNENGEQGYWLRGKWMCTGWNDAGGYWFEEAGDIDEDGQFVPNGYHDCYTPDGDWCETGYWDKDDEWVFVPGYYDDDGVWVDDKSMTPMEKPKPKDIYREEEEAKKAAAAAAATAAARQAEEDNKVFIGEKMLRKGEKGLGGCQRRPGR
eukprot:COSAG05_NODE_2250_length_3338_cov_7.489349_3_plen_264_part_00